MADTLGDIINNLTGNEQEPEHRDYGMHYTYLFIGMSGDRFVDGMNKNLESTDLKISQIDSALNVRIVSNQIKEIKVEDGKTFYTLDDESVEERTWYSLQGEWGKIQGDITRQLDLQQALGEKVNNSDFIILQNVVTQNSQNISTLRSDVNILANSLAAIDSQVNGAGGILIRLDNAETSLARKISSDQVIEIRTTDGLSLEFTTDGTTWKPVSTAGLVEWGDIIGDIANQADLLLLFDNMNDAFEELEHNVNLHIENQNNPHNVTKQQLGLENVDNTSDIDKPLSTAQKEYIDEEVGTLDTRVTTLETGFNNLKIVNIDSTAYEALETKDANTLYFINNL